MVTLKSQTFQYLVCILSVVTVSLLGLTVREVFDYKIIGYLLLFLVSILAIFFEIKPVLLAAILSALALDFLFIKPYYTLHIDNAEDTLLLLLFFGRLLYPPAARHQRTSPRPSAASCG